IRVVSTPEARPIAADELASLREGVAATSIVLDLPRRGPTRLDLAKVEVATDDLLVETAHVERGSVVTTTIAPQRPNAYRGSVPGAADSYAYIGVGTGEAAHLVAGFIVVDGERWWLSNGPREARERGLPPMLSHDSAFDGKSFDGLRCGLEELPDAPEPPGDGGVAGGAGCREFRVAIETDTEFTMNAHGGSVIAAQQYALLLMGAASQVYDREINCRLQTRYLRLWTGIDPWNQTAMGDQLGEYQGYWNTNMGAISRDIGHFLSARSLGGGVAWLSVACANVGYAYGLSSGVGYGFPYPLIDHSHSNWEPMVVCHEIGHNFGAPHTHSMNPPADGCGNNDCSAAWGGTIMSYCHTCSGGMSNIVLEFHPYTLAAIQQFIGGVPCGDAGVKALDDAASVIEGGSVEIAPLANDAFVNCSTVVLTAFSQTTAQGGVVTLPSGSDPAAPVLRYQAPAGFSGTDTFLYGIGDGGASVSSATVYVQVRPILDQTYVLGNVPGLDTRFYALAAEVPVVPDFRTLTPYQFTTLANVEVPSTGGNFSTSGRADLVGATFAGWISIPSTGTWTFFSESDDGSKLFIDGIVVANNDGPHGMVERGGEISLEAGLHQFRYEFFENFGGAGAIARWQGPGVAKAVIPASALSKGGTPMQIDLDADGTVTAADLAILLSNWGPTGGATVPADFDKSGTVDAADLSRLLANWGT
ncbi:MAG: M12 family metallo-peptidase, partial [Planctomycetota bacterium]